MGSVALTDRPVDERVARLMAGSLVWDDHACMPMRWDDAEFLPQLQRCRRAGVDVISLNVGFDALPWENTVRVVAHFRHWVRRRAEEYVLVETVADVQRRGGRGSSRLPLT